MAEENMVERLAVELEMRYMADFYPTLMMLGADLSRDMARAAIEAMREPTAAMLNHESYAAGLWSRRNIEAYFDAALSPTPGQETE